MRYQFVLHERCQFVLHGRCQFGLHNLVYTRDVNLAYTPDVNLVYTQDVNLVYTRDVNLVYTRMSICIAREMSICITREMSISITREMSICNAREMPFYAREMKNSQMLIKSLVICQVRCLTVYPVQNAYNFKLSLLYGMTFIHVVLLHLFSHSLQITKLTHKVLPRFENKISLFAKGNVIRFT